MSSRSAYGAPTRADLNLVIDGCRVLVVTDGTSAVGHVGRHGPDVVILDLHLRGPVTGRNVLDRVRKLPSGASVPVLVVSGDTVVETRSDVSVCAADGFLAKPFDPQDLVAAVMRFAGESSVQRGVRRVQQLARPNAVAPATPTR